MYTIGVDLGGTNIAAGLCDEKLNIIDKDSIPTLAQNGPNSIVERMAELVSKILKRNSLTTDDIEYVGIATPGAVDDKNGIVQLAFNLGFVDFPLADKFREFFPAKRVYIGNDANVAALAEALAGVAKGTKMSVMITLGTGVGGGIIFDNKIFSGALNSAGAELGHIVINAGGRLCTCGRRGCWEAYSSATALTQVTEEKMRELEAKRIPSKLFEYAKEEGKVSARTAFNAMKAGDEHGKALVDWYIENLAVGIANIINIFQPEVISIGGGVCNEKEALTVPLNKIVDREQFTRNNKVKTKVLVAALKNDAGIIGAAGLGK